MNKKTNIQSQVAIALVLFFILFSFVSANNNEITATLRVAPTTAIDCKPDSLTIGSELKWINCFIELNNTNVTAINLATVNLNVQGKNGNVLADQSFSHLGDFDFDDQMDLQVRFNKQIVHNTFFSNINSTTLVTLVVSGTVNEFNFSGSDVLLLVKSPEKLFTKYIVNNTVSQESKINKLPLIDLEKFKISSISFSGYFLSRGDPTLNGMARIYILGTQLVERTVNLFFLNFTFIEKQPIVANALINKYHDCVQTNLSNIYCEGNGTLVVENTKTKERFNMPLSKMTVEIRDKKGKIEGGKFWNEVISISDIPIESIKIS